MADGHDGKTGCTQTRDCGDDGGVCDVDAGECVGCVASGDCSGSTPVCDKDGKTCVGCLVKGDCSGATPVCNSQGHQCVECLADSDCAGARPICDTANEVCVKCATDAQCATKLGPDPGVCMAHADGRCATADETIFVENNSSCSDLASTAGTALQPFCSMQPVLGALAQGGHALVVVRGTVAAGNWTFAGPAGEISIVGQQSTQPSGPQGPFIASAASPALSITGGQLYVRDLKVSSSASIGISATGGALRLDGITVDSCMKGGVLLGGAAFDIRRTTITNNGPGSQGSTTWGGILVSALPGSGSTALSLVTIQRNKQVGLTCADKIQGTGVFASDNAGGVDVNPSCGITVCAAAGPTCGAPL